MFNKLSQEVFVYSLVLIREMTAALRYCPIVIIATFSPASQIFVFKLEESSYKVVLNLPQPV